jgi:DNA-binding XRE family transcriptional regulator
MNADTADSIPVSDAGDRVRMRRERLGATQGEVAEQAGVNRDTVSAVEHGQSSAKSRRLVTDALTRMEEEAGLPPIGDEPLVRRVEPVEGAPQLLRIEVPDMYGGKAIVVEGPVDNPEALAAAVDAIMRRLSGNAPTDQ